jgi:aminotransferase
LLVEEKVAVISGSAFGNGGDNHIRAYCKSYANIEVALGRIRNFVEKL